VTADELSSISVKEPEVEEFAVKTGRSTKCGGKTTKDGKGKK
jgi:hypothetical protein